jgi:hypothetical protein
MPDLTWRSKHVQVVAVCQDAAAKTEHAVHGSREARRDGFHSRSEILLVRRFDDRVHVIVLHRVMNESEAPAVARRSEAALESTHQLHGAQ